MENISQTSQESAEKPRVLIINCKDETTKQRIVELIEELEGHRQIRFQETSTGALSVKFAHIENRLIENLRQQIWNVDSDAEIRDGLGHNERLI